MLNRVLEFDYFYTLLYRCSRSYLDYRQDMQIAAENAQHKTGNKIKIKSEFTGHFNLLNNCF